MDVGLDIVVRGVVVEGADVLGLDVVIVGCEIEMGEEVEIWSGLECADDVAMAMEVGIVVVLRFEEIADKDFLDVVMAVLLLLLLFADVLLRIYVGDETDLADVAFEPGPESSPISVPGKLVTLLGTPLLNNFALPDRLLLSPVEPWTQAWKFPPLAVVFGPIPHATPATVCHTAEMLKRCSFCQKRRQSAAS